MSLLYFLTTAVLFYRFGVPWPIVLKAVLWFAFTLWLLRGAPQLVRFAYRDDE